MVWRRAIGAGIMLAGAAAVMAMAAQATLLSAAGVRAGTDAIGIIVMVARETWALLGGGVLAMAAGRLVYGHWWRAAPIANLTGDVARTVGLAAAFALGGMLVFLLASGFKPDDDAPAAIALGLGAALGVALAQFGGRLRGGRT